VARGNARGEFIFSSRRVRTARELLLVATKSRLRKKASAKIKQT
jgi:hypothetical protein